MVIRLLLLLLLPLQSFAISFTAEVNRTQITQNDSLSLVLTIDEQVHSSPDFKSLNNDFEIISQRRNNQFRMINGTTTSVTQWELQIAPLKEGSLVIPSFSLSNAQTKPITISVKPMSQELIDKAGKEVFFEATLDKREGYVQEQFIYSEKLYFTIPLKNSTLSEIKIADAVVTALGEPRQYETRINNVPHGVIERHFAIFPQVSGELMIPAQRFTAVAGNRYSRRNVSAVSKAIKVKVKPTPASYPQAPWLPATQLSIVESWPNSTDHLIQGEGITRSLRIDATGLSGAQIPAIAQPVVNGLKYYPDQSKNDEKVAEHGITGTRLESIAIVPTQSGYIELPEIRIPWWNTKTNKLEYATLPARSLNIMPPTQQLQPSEQAQTPVEDVINDNQAADTSTGNILYWMLAVALLAATNIVTLIYLLMARRRTLEKDQSDTLTDDKKSAAASINERSARSAFNKACKQNDPTLIRSSLITLMSFKTLNKSPSLDDVALEFPTLKEQIDLLNTALYSNHSDQHGEHPAYSSDLLLKEVNTIKASSIKATKDALRLYK
jgi:hypothetical protein